MKPVCLINLVGLTPRLVGADTPRLSALAGKAGAQPLRGVCPAVTCSAQATMLTGTPPATHGIIGNGWLYRDTQEIRFWQQARSLVQAETVYDAARRRNPDFTCAKLFWWFNQGAGADWSLTPKPWYGCDGNKLFGVHGAPDAYVRDALAATGVFPFHTFWGPEAGLPCTDWIARATAWTLKEKRPTLTMVYLPHLDYDLQRYGVSASQTCERLREVDACAGVVIEAAKSVGAEVVVVSEYGLSDVSRPVHINRILREHGFLVVRDGPFGEQIDVPACRAVAVADHQIAHVYVNDSADRPAVRDVLASATGIAEVWGEAEKVENGLAHSRSGELVTVAAPDAWFTYYFWQDDVRAPDYARTVDIHRKPGYDPCELFYDPALCCPRGRAAWRLLQKRLGFRTRFDVVPLDASLVRGSHGRPSASPDDGAVFLSTAAAPDAMAMTGVKEYLLDLMRIGGRQSREDFLYEICG